MNRRATGAALFVLAVMMSTSGSTDKTIGNDRYGVSPGADILWLPDDELDRELDLYQAMGFGWIRLDIDWNSIEPTPGAFDWEGTDQVVRGARDRGLQILAMPAYTPAWAASVPGDPHSEPTDPRQYADFVAAAVNRYAPLGVHSWEIWNEPNSSAFWQPQPDAAGYAELLTATAAVIRASDADAVVVAGALAPAADAKNGSQISPLTFVRQLYKAGASDDFDVLSVHPYTYPLTADDADSSWRTSFPLARIRREMVNQGAPKPIWITEFGAPTGTDPQAGSDEEQAQILVSALAPSRPWVERVFLYGGRDRGTDPADREQNFGFVRLDFSDKASRAAIEDTLRGGSTSSPSP